MQSSIQNGECSSGPDNEIEKSLEYLSSSYDDLSTFQKTAKIELERFDKSLNSLEAKVDGITDAIDNLECYSYQYNPGPILRNFQYCTLDLKKH